ncbi:GDYXXLXY domain-containing protein [Chromatiaceae bacterium AAb-1]|nr:GDYXXLXY domain-containing protein [Chromatiaceae bacterium AAb-1]
MSFRLITLPLTPRQRTLAVLGATLLVLLAALWSINRNERILSNGTELLAELAPVDPRSMMQGDYMALAFALDLTLPQDASDYKYVWLTRDQHNVAQFHSVSNRLPDTTGIIAVVLRQRDGMFSIGPNAFFFAEGTGHIYEQARYGEFRVDNNGNALLKQLRDDKLQPIRAATP